VARPGIRRLVKFAAVSVVAVVVSQTTLLVTFGLLGWEARPANLTSFVLSTIPSFELNRRWTWRQGPGRRHVRRELIPFWVLAFLGLVASDQATRWAAELSEGVDSRAMRTLVVMLASLSAYGILWVVKFLLLDRLVWSGPPMAAAAALPEEQ
jgi:putative flippase GtrA